VQQDIGKKEVEGCFGNEAIADGRLLATMFQDPVQLGKTAMQELLSLFQQPHPATPPTPKKVLVPVKKITRENLPPEWLHAKDTM
jgi:ABC-type sugar transport system substrate-binding protein